MSENTVAAPEQQKQTPEQPKRNKYAGDKRKRKMPVWIKIVIAVVVIGAIVAGAVYVIRKATASSAPMVIEGTVCGNTLSDQVVGWSTIAAKQTADYGVGLTGTITEVDVEAGQTVMAGDLLFVIDPVQLRTELDKAEKELAAAEKQLAEVTGDLDLVEVSAPFRGKLIKATTLKKGDSGTAGTCVGTLVDDSVMRLELYFARGLYDSVKVGQRATVSLPAQMQELEGTVVQIDDIQKPVDGLLCFRAFVDFNNPGALTAGDTATAAVMTADGEVTPIGAGTMNYSRSAELTLATGGRIAYCDLMEYGVYAAGQRLISLDTEELREKIAAAQESYDKAYESAEELRARIENTEVRAEIDGLVTGVVIEEGTKIENSPTPLVTVSNTSSLVMNINISDLDIGKVSVGMDVEVSSDSGAYALGKLTYVSFTATASGDEWSGMSSNYPATVSLENDGTMLPGMGVNYTITAMVKDWCMTVPSMAVNYTETGDTIVFVKEEQEFSYERAEGLGDIEIPEGFYPVYVTTGLSDAYNTEVEGLEEGTVVYVGTASNKGMWG